MLHDVITLIEPLVQKKHNTLEVHCIYDLGTMHADLTKVRQSLFNLLSNASKFTENGVIALYATRETVEGTDWVIFRVCDSGIGMTEEQMQRIFEPFTQADASTTRQYGGTGLGLSITRKFCEMMGGSIMVESRPGDGSTFIIRLPTTVAAHYQEDNEDRLRLTPLLAVNKILVIDSDTAIRDHLKRTLTREGFSVYVADNVEHGLLFARDLRPMAITLDVQMAESDGWAMLAMLKTDPTLQQIPVIVLSNLENPETAYAQGAADVLSKPLDQGLLANALKRYQFNHQPHCLIAEDDKSTRELMHSLLVKSGWRVTEAADGEAALQQMQHDAPDLILLDLSMPKMDGFIFWINCTATRFGKRFPWW
jgi:CheY-like chemotaxis protein